MACSVCHKTDNLTVLGCQHNYCVGCLCASISVFGAQCPSCQAKISTVSQEEAVGSRFRCSYRGVSFSLIRPDDVAVAELLSTLFTIPLDKLKIVSGGKVRTPVEADELVSAGSNAVLFLVGSPLGGATQRDSTANIAPALAGSPHLDPDTYAEMRAERQAREKEAKRKADAEREHKEQEHLQTVRREYEARHRAGNPSDVGGGGGGGGGGRVSRCSSLSSILGYVATPNMMQFGRSAAGLFVLSFFRPEAGMSAEEIESWREYEREQAVAGHRRGLFAPRGNGPAGGAPHRPDQPRRMGRVGGTPGVPNCSPAGGG